MHKKTESYRQWRRAYDNSPVQRRKKWEGVIRRRFGITPEDVARAYDAQDAKCAGCLIELDLGYHTHIDHDHVTGEFRGLLCGNCNEAIGLLYDNRNTLLRLVEYLGRSY